MNTVKLIGHTLPTILLAFLSLLIVLFQGAIDVVAITSFHHITASDYIKLGLWTLIAVMLSLRLWPKRTHSSASQTAKTA